MAAADLRPGRSLADDRKIGVHQPFVYYPSRAQLAAGLLVGGERTLNVKSWLSTRFLERLHGYQQRGDCPFHIPGAAAVERIAGQPWLKRVAEFPLPRTRHHVVVGIEMYRLRSADVPPSNQVVARELVRAEHAAHLLVRDAVDFGLHVQILTAPQERVGHRSVVPPRRIGGIHAHERLQAAEQLFSMLTDVLVNPSLHA